MNDQDITNQIRLQRGLDPINPFVIQDSGEPPAPPLPLPDLDSEEENFGPEYPPEPSPLIALGKLAEPERQENQPIIPPPDLIIWGEAASYKNRAALLTDQEQNRVAKVVIGALARVVRDQLAQVSSLLPRRKRRKVEAAEAPKKRGRPRKTPLPE